MAVEVNNSIKTFSMIENYIYLYHLNKFVIIPSYPDSISDSLSSTFNATNVLARTAPIYTYSYSGPRTVQISLTLHRDMMEQINYGNDFSVEFGDDYVDTIIKELQSIALPKYAATSKMVDPPMIAVRFGSDIFIKGVVIGGVTVTYSLPLLDNGKYATVAINFSVSEVDPYDAESVASMGSLRGLSQTLQKSLYKQREK